MPRASVGVGGCVGGVACYNGPHGRMERCDWLCVVIRGDTSVNMGHVVGWRSVIGDTRVDMDHVVGWRRVIGDT